MAVKARVASGRPAANALRGRPLFPGPGVAMEMGILIEILIGMAVRDVCPGARTTARNCNEQAPRLDRLRSAGNELREAERRPRRSV